MAPKPTTHHPTNYKSTVPKRLDSLFDGRLKKSRIREYIHHELTTEGSRFLTNGKALVWVMSDADGRISFSVDDNDKHAVSIAVAIKFVASAVIVKDDHPKFWGYETEEEWVNALKEKQRETEVVPLG